ncbi:MAG: hypothetical protein R2792_03590 [Saprospiraceae bacterium]
MEFSLSYIDIGIILVYLVGVLYLGFYFGSKHKDAEDYFLAGRSLTWPIIGFSCLHQTCRATAWWAYGAGYKTVFRCSSHEWVAVLILIIFAIFFSHFI